MEPRNASVTLAEDLEQQLGAGGREWHIADFVDDQQRVAGNLTLQAEQALLVSVSISSWALFSYGGRNDADE